MNLDAIAVEKTVVGLTDLINESEEKHRKETSKYRKILKEIREALDDIPIFSSDLLEDHKIACQAINEILEDNSF